MSEGEETRKDRPRELTPVGSPNDPSTARTDESSLATNMRPGDRTGWYPDPANNTVERYWDGTEWIAQRPLALGTHPQTTSFPIAAPVGHDATTRRFWTRGRLWGIVIGLFLIGAGLMANAVSSHLSATTVNGRAVVASPATATAKYLRITCSDSYKRDLCNDDQNSLVSLGRDVCSDLNKGQSLQEVDDEMLTAATNTGAMLDADVGVVIAGAEEAFCPQYVSANP